MDPPPASGAPRTQAMRWGEEGGGELPAERIALGTAIFDRADEIGRLVDVRFSEVLRGEAYSTARLATELIGRWIATDQVATVEEEAIIARQGEQAIVEDTDLAVVTKAYFAWRDTIIAIVEEEAHRLGVSDALLTLTRSVVRLSSDGSLVRIVREFDAARRRLQQQLREEQDRLAHRALHDELTGLPNRSLLTDRLGQSARAAERRESSSMLLYLDLDDFKEINDRYGHRAGDAMLMAVASRLGDLVRSADTVARLGGDEFVVLAEELDHPDATARSLAERIHLVMQEPVVVGERELRTSVSIGIAPVVPGSDPEVCLSRADVAMYEAKRLGPDRHVVFSEALDAESCRRSRLADELPLAHPRGQFTIHYQPLFQQSGTPVGVEALLRWQHPELGSIAPDEFVPMLEQSRDIVTVGRWVLATAAAQCQRWRDQGWPGLTLSVNVSRRQLQDHGFFDDVREALHASGLDAGSLVLELSESVLMAGTADIDGVMHKLRDLGLHLALDNFGRGGSSLLHLRDLPIDRLKVDHRFVHGLGSGAIDDTVVAGVVDLAHRMGLCVVASGVETEGELAALEAMGCDEVQGFLLGHPVDAPTLAGGSDGSLRSGLPFAPIGAAHQS